MREDPRTTKSWMPGIVAALAALAVFVAYSNHFQNAFHFDDFHTIVNNPAIRSLTQLPHFFTDARTFSILPTHASYRPLVSASAALDYRLGGGLNPLFFHISTFAWFILQLGLMYLLFVRMMDLTLSGPNNRYFALFAVVWYGLHPANAETINYVIQRADLYSTLGVVAGLVIYCSWHQGRVSGLYLVPVAAGVLAKPMSLVFPALLFFYLLLFGDPSSAETSWSIDRVRARRCAQQCLPALIACAGLAMLQIAMTPRTFMPGAPSRSQYWLTQPIVAFHYFKSFFLPTELSADTDRELVSNIFSETSAFGLLFLCAVLLGIRYSLRRREHRPIAFGLLWFLIALVPTSIFPLAEPENDHRMFFPFVGLTLAVTWATALLIEKKGWLEGPRSRSTLIVCSLAWLLIYGSGAYARNAVWHSEESLWLDVVRKSPRDGRGLMNYGVTQLAKGNFPVAYEYFRRASVYTPFYSTLEINLGVAAGALNRDAEAEAHFQRAISLAPQDSQSYFFYGRWLRGKGRIPEALSNLTRSAALNASDLDPRYLLMTIYAGQSDWPDVSRVSAEILQVAPADSEALRYRVMAQDTHARVSQAERLADAQPTPENYVGLSLLYWQTGRYEDCIRAAHKALELRPDYAEAYNNIAAGYQSMGRWDDAIHAARKAISLKPDFQIARNNLAYSLSRKEIRDKTH
jgi:protein O-mannosyl-transferase